MRTTGCPQAVTVVSAVTQRGCPSASNSRSFCKWLRKISHQVIKLGSFIFPRFYYCRISYRLVFLSIARDFFVLRRERDVSPPSPLWHPPSPPPQCARLFPSIRQSLSLSHACNSYAPRVHAAMRIKTNISSLCCCFDDCSYLEFQGLLFTFITGKLCGSAHFFVKICALNRRVVLARSVVGLSMAGIPGYVIYIQYWEIMWVSTFFAQICAPNKRNDLARFVVVLSIAVTWDSRVSCLQPFTGKLCGSAQFFCSFALQMIGKI